MKLERRNLGLLCASLFLTILGVKAFLIHRFGSDLPYWDQWAKEGEMILAPAREGTLRWSALFVPHSEHRIVPTLLLNLGLAEWSGQWDARVECVVNAMLHTGFMVLLTGYVFRVYSPRAGLVTAWLQLALTVAALDWENTLGGFQSQFYFLIGFSLTALWGLLDPRGPLTGRWWIGLVGGGLATISMGSGLLCFLPCAGLAGLRLLRPGEGRGRSAVTLLTCAAVVLLAWLTRGVAPWEEANHATSVRDFALYFAHCLAWPAAGWTALAAMAWLPWLRLAVRRLGRSTPRQELLLAAGGWVLLQIAAVSYYRGVDGGYPAVRYADIFLVGVLVNALVWFDEPAAWSRAGRVSGMLWLVVIAGGAVSTGASAWRGTLPSIAGRSRVYEENVALYLKNGDVAQLSPPHQVPFPMVDWLKRMLDRPSLRAMLPVSVRPEVPESFASAWAREAAAAGAGLAAVGIVLLLAGSALTWPRTE